MKEVMHFQTFAETIPHLVWSARADGVSDYYNTRFLNYLGKTLEEMQGWPWADTLHPDDRQRSMETWTEALTHGTDCCIEYRIRRAADGQYRWHEGRAVPLRDKKGRIVRWFGTCTDIEERKAAEEKYHRFASLTSEYIHYCTSSNANTFQAQWVDGSLVPISGYSPQDILQTGCFLSVVHPDDKQTVASYLQSLIPGDRKSIDFRIVTKEGEVRWVSEQSYCEAGQSPGELDLYGAVTDITERKQVEERLRESESKFRTLYETMMDGFVCVDMAGHILEHNSSYRDLLGYSEEELRTKTYFDLTPAKWHDIEARIVAEQVIPHGHSTLYEKEYFRKDGSIVPIELRTYLIRADNGEPSYMWAIIRDVTERKREEQTLRNNEQRLNYYVNNSPLATIEWDASFKVTLWSVEAEKIFGWSQNETIGKLVMELDMIYEEDIPLVQKVIEKLTDGSEKYLISANRNYSKDGRVIYCEWYNTILTDPDGRMVSVLSQVMDVTARKEAEQTLAKAKVTLEKEVQERTASLTLANELLTREIEERKRIEQYLLEHQHRLEEMGLELSLAADRERGRIAGELHDEVGQRLVVSRFKLDALASKLSGLEHDQAVMELQQQIDQTIKDIRSLTFQLRPPILSAAGLVAAVRWLGEELRSQHGLVVEIEHDATPIALPYEKKSALFQVVRELLVNVAKHASTDRAVVAIKTVGGTLHIIVTDSGVGCDVSKVLAKHGMPDGFGLFNTQKMIEHLGGQLVIESMPGKGCRVSIHIPLPSRIKERPHEPENSHRR